MKVNVVYRLKSLAWLLLLWILFGFISCALYKISGRGTPADGVRPLIVLLLGWWASSILYRLGWRLYARIINTIMAIAIFMVVLFFVYYQRIDSFITGDDMVAILQSNPEEQFDFLIFNILRLSAIGWSALAALVFIALSEILFFFNRSRFKDKPFKHPKVWFVLAILFQLGALGVISQLRPIKFYFIMQEQYTTQIKQFNELSQKVQATAQTPAIKEQQGELYVLITGESLNRDLMGCYNGFLDNTPFLSELTQQPETICFTHAYASFVNTMPAVTNALSQGNIARGLTFPEGENLFAVLRSAGVKSAWISNQVRQSRFDTPIAAMADKTDYQYFSIEASEGSSKQQRPDAYLLPQIEKYLATADPTENHLLVIHLMGNHSPYDHRYPNDFREYNYEGKGVIGIADESFDARDELNEYLTSIRYNDEVLQKIYQMCAPRQDFAAMVYLSDHAEEVTPPGGRHNMGQFSYNMVRIPLIVHLSPRYTERYPDTWHTLQLNVEQPFTNDCLYDLMLGLMQVKSSEYAPELSLTTPDYAQNFASARLVQDKPLLADPQLQGELNLKQIKATDPQFVLIDGNSIFKSALAMNSGVEHLLLPVTSTDDMVILDLKPQQNVVDFIDAMPRAPRTVLLQFEKESPINVDAVFSLADKFLQTEFICLVDSTAGLDPSIKSYRNIRFALDLRSATPSEINDDFSYAVIPCAQASAVSVNWPHRQKLIALDCDLNVNSANYLHELQGKAQGLKFVGGRFSTPFDCNTERN